MRISDWSSDVCSSDLTDMKRELEHMGRFLTMARDYARKNGFKGNFFIEPKPCEPTKHQYDYDSATVISFLRQYDLMEDFKINVEVNRSEEHTSELQSLMRISYAVFCLKKKKKKTSYVTPRDKIQTQITNYI